MRQLVAAGASLAKIRIGFIFKRDKSWYLPKMFVPIVFNLVAGAGKKSVWGKYCCEQWPFLVERVWTLDAENGPRKPSTSLAAHPAQELQLCFPSLSLSLFFFGCTVLQAGSSFFKRGWQLRPLQWKRGFLPTGPPAKSRPLCS